MSRILIFLQQDSNLIIRIIQRITVAIQDGQVQASDLGHLLEIETGSPRIKKVGYLGKDQEIEVKVIEEANHQKEINMAAGQEANHLKENNMVAGQEVNHNMTAGLVPPQTHVVIDMRKLLQGRPHQTASKLEEMEHSLLYRGVTYVVAVGHRTEIGLAANHVIGLPHHSLAEMDPEDANNNLLNAGTTAQGHVPILKDVRAILSNGVADLRTGKELLATRVDLPADQMNQDSARTAVVQTVVWHNAPYLRNANFLTGDVSYVLPCCFIGPLLITNYLRIQGPPLQ